MTTQVSTEQFNLAPNHVFTAHLSKLGIRTFDDHETLELATRGTGRVSNWKVSRVERSVVSGAVVCWVFVPADDEIKRHPRLGKFSLVVLNQ